MITAEILQAKSTKTYCAQGRAHGNMQMRDPSTIIGFLTRETIAKHSREYNPDMLIMHGVTIFNDNSVCFAVDDSQYGYPIIQGCGFSGTTFTCDGPINFRVTSRPELPTGMIYTIDELLMIFYTHPKKLRFLETEEELLAYLNNR